MKSLLSFVSMILFLCSGTLAQTAYASDYKFIKKTGATSLYERWIKGLRGEEVRELKAVLIVEASVDKIEQLLKNPAAGTSWNTRASQYRIAATPQPHQWVNYIRYDMPAIMDDQDCCLLFTKKILADQVTELSFRSTLADVFPKTNGVKRITGVKGKWRLEPLSKEKTKITYTITSDKSGQIPRIISDPIIRDNLFSTMANFKSLVEK